MSWLAPAPVIETRIFSALPAEFRRARKTAWSEANKGGAAVDCFLEGPCFDASGNLYCTDIPNGRIFRVNSAGEWTLVAEYDGEPNGLKVRADGTLLVADYRRGLLAVDPANGSIEPVLARRHSESFRGLNDLALAANGDVYFTDQGQTGLHDPSGRVYRLRAGGQLDLLLANVPSPNGIVLDAAERVLFVAATRGNEVWRVPLQPDGGVSKVGRFVSLYGTSGPDGLAMAEDDSLCVAHASLGAVFVFAASGEPRWRIASCAGKTTTNLAFGGKARSTVYITESSTGSILAAALPVAGKSLPLV
jgi:gluconolactonase